MALVSPTSATAATTFRASGAFGRRDALLLTVLAVLTAGICIVDLPGSERVIPLAALAAVAIGWVRSRHEHWLVTGTGITHRRWITTNTAAVSSVQSVEIVRDGHGLADEVRFVAPGVSIPVSLYDIQSQPDFAAELRLLLAGAVDQAVPGADTALALL